MWEEDATWLALEFLLWRHLRCWHFTIPRLSSVTNFDYMLVFYMLTVYKQQCCIQSETVNFFKMATFLFEIKFISLYFTTFALLTYFMQAE